MESTLVIKVKYGETLRRFNARIDENEQLDLDMGRLRVKILGLFNFSLDADLTLTYVDEDGDIVVLVDDDDLRDVMRQRLKFLRIDVQLNNGKGGKFFPSSSRSSTPLRSPRFQHLLPTTNLNTIAAEVLKCMPESVHETLLKLDLICKIANSSPVLNQLVGRLSKMGQSHLNPASESKVGADSGVPCGAPESNTVPLVGTNPNVSKDDGLPEVVSKSESVETSKNNQKVDVGNMTRDVEAPVIPPPAYINLNLEPSDDSNPTGCTTLHVAESNVSVGDRRKETEKDREAHLRGKSSFAPASSSDPMRPIYLYPSQASDKGGNPLNKCPFTKMPSLRDTAVPPYPDPPIQPLKRSYKPAEAMGSMFHKGVRCDGCGVHPITGPRFKSKVKEDYDLCCICFSVIGNEADYIQIDHPVFHRPHRMVKGQYDQTHNSWVCPPALPHLMQGCGSKPVWPKLDSLFIADVNVMDGTIMAPLTPFTKIWRMCNSGSLVWPRGTKLVWIGGDKFSAATSVEIEIPQDGVPVDGELDIAIDSTAPELPGRYISYWRMASPSGQKFGQRVWVLVQVDYSLKDSSCDYFQGLNLNLPPYDGSDSKAPEIMDMNARPAVDGNFLESHSSNAVAEPSKLKVAKQRKNQEVNSSMIGPGVSALVPEACSSSSSVSSPIIVFPEASPSAPSHAPPPVIDAPTSHEGIGETSVAVEMTLLKELEEMGFKQVDLNKEILRMNKYNLEQSVDDLFDVADWDPILEELQEMGFCDRETNERLLQKNNGSIKRVVMDLITGEKA